MASPDKDEESSSLWASQTEPWDAILKAVREQLPSLDSDSSLSDCGPDELFIFQRDQTALIPDLSEELAEDPAGAWLATADGPSEAGVVSVELTAGRWSKGGAKTKGSASVQGGDPDGPVESCGETSSLCQVPADIPTWEEGDHEALSFSTQGSPWGPHREATFSPWEDDLKTEPPGAASPAGWSTDSKDHRAPQRERRKMIEDILHKVTWDARGPACSDRNPAEEATAGLRPETPPEGPREGPLVLSLKELEEWDLDHILQSLAGQEGDRGDRAPRATWWAADRLGRDQSRPNCQDRLMEQLTLLCAAQSQAPSADRPQDTTQHEARSRSAACIQAELGLAQSRQLRSPAEPPTIFIDLRPSEPSDPGSVESSSPSSFDSEEEEEETVALRDQQGRPEQESPSPRQLWDCTGKSQLLQQLRAFRKETAQPNWPANGGPSGWKAQVPEDPASSATRRKQHVPAWAEPQNTQARCPGGGPRALGDALGPGTAREALVPPLSQP
ncbi:dynein axonemal assembly factor 8 [Mustela putorius furo]|uniref:Dynein axonemal assembly factor 8 n=2 Tax=Mustela putorius furo TaxID=9669 RepID=M3YU43_MUSPF|nr:dynein axonemal assembly factor 8 [Mustela putorius furo]XP_004750527.1 dynein axonemal assembly factor 8 [Mustela putorius furo]XP_004750528.1 dynein axonemal assembly factor 8 [Mustela putorius furo]XP_004750529.1 dynein axonemal assembly factor 8 [Mustela putorius furo]XP_004750530.1 dynein axonemal assembly factor 8 [Mustela putorius furo]XP_004750531.1 dynein axonemal assembly factor 8 [Mustela putorius furo]XP_012910516.1 dynein axonemal assembly factor 8 [Mustela putorius furo]XP_0